MDYTKSNRIRDNKDFNKIAKDEFKTLFRQDIQKIFKAFIKDKELNHPECIIVKKFVTDAIQNEWVGQYRSVNKTSYYNLALELYDKLLLNDATRLSVWSTLCRKNKLNINEQECLVVYLISLVNLELSMAILKEE